MKSVHGEGERVAQGIEVGLLAKNMAWRRDLPSKTV